MKIEKTQTLKKTFGTVTGEVTCTNETHYNISNVDEATYRPFTLTLNQKEFEELKVIISNIIVETASQSQDTQDKEMETLETRGDNNDLTNV